MRVNLSYKRRTYYITRRVWPNVFMKSWTRASTHDLTIDWRITLLSVHFFAISVLGPVRTSVISHRIPFNGFPSHFHYCNLLFQWCIVVGSLPTLSFLPPDWRVWLTTFHFSQSPTLPLHLCTTQPWATLQMDSKLIYVTLHLCWKKLNGARGRGCIEIRGNLFSSLVPGLYLQLKPRDPLNVTHSVVSKLFCA